MVFLSFSEIRYLCIKLGNVVKGKKNVAEGVQVLPSRASLYWLIWSQSSQFCCKEAAAGSLHVSSWTWGMSHAGAQYRTLEMPKCSYSLLYLLLPVCTKL